MSCCPTELKPVTSGYTKKSLEYYIAGVGSSKAIILTPDIFGRHPNAFQLADVLASNGFLVVFPDYFREKPWSTSRMPLGDADQQDFAVFFEGIQYDKVKSDVVAAADVARRLGATSVGMIGLCWGGKIAMRANADGIVSCCAAVHPSRIVEQDGKDVKGPVCFLPSKDEPNLDDVVAAMQVQPFAAKNVYQRYDDLHHGFMGARADYSDEKFTARVEEVLKTVVDFFAANL